MSDNETLAVTQDDVSHPKHYNSHPSGVEVKEITGPMACPHLANTVKYLCRHKLKGNPTQDLRKAAEYARFEASRRLSAIRWGGYVSPVSWEAPRWRADYAPFWKYIEHEPDWFVRELLIDVWNADKTDDEDAAKKLNEIADRMRGRANMEERNAKFFANMESEVGAKLAEWSAAEPKPEHFDPIGAALGEPIMDEAPDEPDSECVQVRLTASAASKVVSEGDLIHGAQSGFKGREITGVLRSGRDVTFQTKDGDKGPYDVNRHVYVTIPKEHTA